MNIWGTEREEAFSEAWEKHEQEQEALFALVCFFTGYKPEPTELLEIDTKDNLPF